LDVDQIERVRRDVGAIEAVGRAAVPRDDHRSTLEGRESRVVLHATGDVLVISKRQPTLPAAIVDGRQPEHPMRSGHRQAAKRMRVQDGEQHVVHADADSEDQHRGDRKAAVPVQ
jgi:hypothetical protein